MYEEFLGKGYHQKIRKMLGVDENILPDRIIDADLNIGAMKSIIGESISEYKITNKQKYDQLASAALYYLCGVLCMVLKSRCSTPPFDLPKYRKNWDKKQKKYMQKGNLIIEGLKQSA